MSIEIEVRLAELQRTVDDLNEVVTRQSREIDRLTAQVRVLIEREALREAESAIVVGDERPPHY